MKHLPSIKAEQKTGEETATNNGQVLDWKIQDFWKWSSSDLLSNATRGILAEFIVRQALEIKEPLIRNEWDAYDLITDKGLKIEVKSSAYIQSWEQDGFSRMSFSIKPSKAYNYKTKTYDEEVRRQADMYVFCLLAHKNQRTINPMALDQWVFYIVPTDTLNALLENRSQIGLSELEKLASPLKYAELKDKIHETSN
ncbi:hypothetical protein [Robertkochia aurantiaca]|uniref:hypothetical protein n=1 Tax=Robertkochia aurantiaca TaxID=2873700 RepID=UPI001CC969FC|nr:hypothetical protein [Robertkochia sp. 3YJGBD-33]